MAKRGAVAGDQPRRAAPEQSHLARLARFSRPRDARKDVEQPITLRIDSGRAIYIRKAFATVTPLARLRCARPPADPAPPASPVIAFSIALITDPPVPPQRSTAALPVRPRHKNHDGLLLHRRAPSRLSRPSRGEAQPHGQVRPSPGASPRDRRARESRGLEVHRRLEAPGAFAPELTDERPEASRVGTDFVCRSEGFSRGRSPLTRPSLFDHPTIQPPRTSMQTTR